LSLGENLKKIRTSKNITQKELARKLGVSIRTIQNYESGNREPSIKTLENISDILEVSTNELITGQSLFEGTGGLLGLSKLILDKSLYSENQEIRDLLIEDVIEGIINVYKKDRPNFKVFKEYKENPLQYWHDVIVLCPLTEFYKCNLNNLKDNEINEIAKALEITFKLKLLELKDRKDNEK